MIIANAFPKHGTNLVKKTLGGLGLHHEVGMLRKHNTTEPLEFRKGDRGLSTKEVLGLPDGTFVHGHVCPPIVLRPSIKVVHIVRNPRNAVVSFLRWVDGRDENVPKRIRYDHDGLELLLLRGAYTYGPWCQAMLNFSTWIHRPGVCVVKFENICSDAGRSVERIAHYVGIHDQKLSWRVYDGLYGNEDRIGGVRVTRDKSTWTGRLSDWRECEFWDEELWEKVWGPEVERAYGY